MPLVTRILRNCTITIQNAEKIDVADLVAVSVVQLYSAWRRVDETFFSMEVDSDLLP